MLYLAEVQKQGGSLLGRARTELKLLAYQESEVSWEMVRGEEPIPYDDGGNLNPGTLVLVDLGRNKQVQRLMPDTSKQLVSILQNFSRQQKEFRRKEDEIEQWKVSLTEQSKLLNQKLEEAELSRQEAESMLEEASQVEEKIQEAARVREEAERLQEELARSKQELEGAWAHLNGEKRRLEEQGGGQGGAGLSEDQSRQVQELLDRLSGTVAPTESLRELLNSTFELVQQQQDTLDYHWQQLETKQSSVDQQQAEVNQEVQALSDRWQEWHGSQQQLEQSRAQVEIQNQLLTLKQEQAKTLQAQIQDYEEVYRQIVRLVDPIEAMRATDRVDVDTLQNMPLEELQVVVDELSREFGRISQFHNDQEEELRLQQEAIDELQAKMAQASEYERLSLEAELADEQESYRMLNESVMGSRRSIEERQDVLNLHQMILMRRQGLTSEGEPDNRLDLEPILARMAEQRQQHSLLLDSLDQQIRQIQDGLQSAQRILQQQEAELNQRQSELKTADEALKRRQAAISELLGQVYLYREALQPIQDQVNRVREKLEAISGVTAQVQEVSDYQLQATGDLRQTLLALKG